MFKEVQIQTINKKIFIVVKTYPNVSKKYKELVCTAGITEEGEWVRIYPIPFRTLDAYRQFKRYTWINAEITKDQSDPRPESYKVNISTIEIVDHVLPSKDWGKRRHFILQDAKVYKSLEYIKNMAKSDKMSLCTFKPTKYLDVIAVPNNKKELTKQEQLEFINANRSLFDDQVTTEEFEAMPHIPYSFKITFEDEMGIQSTLSVIDWEIPQLYLRCRNQGDSETVSIQKVKDKLWKFIEEQDLYLFLGTMKMPHIWKVKNPYTIIGLFYPPKVSSYQATLF